MKRRRVADFSQPSSGSDKRAIGLLSLTKCARHLCVPPAPVMPALSRRWRKGSGMAISSTSMAPPNTAMKSRPRKLICSVVMVILLLPGYQASDMNVDDLAHDAYADQHQHQRAGQHFLAAGIVVQQIEEGRIGQLYHRRCRKRQQRQYPGRQARFGR